MSELYKFTLQRDSQGPWGNLVKANKVVVAATFEDACVVAGWDKSRVKMEFQTPISGVVISEDTESHLNVTYPTSGAV